MKDLFAGLVLWAVAAAMLSVAAFLIYGVVVSFN